MTASDAATPAFPATIEVLVQGYLHSLKAGQALEEWYATEQEAGPLGPVTKFGSGPGEVFWDRTAVVQALRQVTSSLTENRLALRGEMLRHVSGEVGWFVCCVDWSGREASQDNAGGADAGRGTVFASLTRWTGICCRTARGWRLLHLHVSEEVGGPEPATPNGAHNVGG